MLIHREQCIYKMKHTQYIAHGLSVTKLTLSLANTYPHTFTPTQDYIYKYTHQIKSHTEIHTYIHSITHTHSLSSTNTHAPTHRHTIHRYIPSRLFLPLPSHTHHTFNPISSYKHLNIYIDVYSFGHTY